MGLIEVIKNDVYLSKLFSTVEYNGIDYCKLKSAKAKKFLAKAGDYYDYILLTVSGDLSVFLENENGKSYVTERIGKYKAINELELIAGEPAIISTIMALTDCSYISIPKDIYYGWFLRYHSFTIDVSVRLGKSLCNLSKTNGVNILYNSEMKLAFYMERAYKEANKPEVKISESRGFISESIGVSVRTVNRVIAKFAALGLIKLEKGKILINSECIKGVRYFINNNKSE
ncbi:MAG: Crp/Fnr family transcriptional regulator [Clostridiales bacterium]|jgi:CRP-like cAMP-binding protein|nr:Crp/Fnr family transcriptional regulator [Clostridiales bacterium]